MTALGSLCCNKLKCFLNVVPLWRAELAHFWCDCAFTFLFAKVGTQVSKPWKTCQLSVIEDEACDVAHTRHAVLYDDERYGMHYF